MIFRFLVAGMMLLLSNTAFAAIAQLSGSGSTTGGPQVFTTDFTVSSDTNALLTTTLANGNLCLACGNDNPFSVTIVKSWIQGGGFFEDTPLSIQFGPGTSTFSSDIFTLFSGDVYTLSVEYFSTSDEGSFTSTVSAVPLPAAFWLFGSALVGFVVLSRSKQV